MLNTQIEQYFQLGLESQAHLFHRGLARILGLDQLATFRRKAHCGASREWFGSRALKALGIRIEAKAEHFPRIPQTGGLLVVANHPFGMVDGLAVAELIRQVRPDVKILANRLLGLLPELREDFILLDLTSQTGGGNLASIREALLWVRSGHVLIIFPAGEIPRLRPLEAEMPEGVWSLGAFRLARKCGAPVLPLAIHGRHEGFMALASMLPASLRTLLFPRMLLRRRDRPVQISIGRPQASRYWINAQEGARGIRRMVDVLEEAEKCPAIPIKANSMAALAPAQLSESLNRELRCLPREQFLLERAPYCVFWAEGKQIPRLLLELGRLRELTFREIGEGTGKSLDFDRFDGRYLHLIAWDQRESRIVGAYRMGASDRILPALGIEGLYSSTLFSYGAELLDALGPSLELGRSFVCPDYQRSSPVLSLLWKGIARFVLQNPDYGTLWGPVSISQAYHPLSRELIVSYLHRSPFLHPLWERVASRNPFIFRPWAKFEKREAWSHLSLDELDALIRELESDGKGMPMLLRHYLKQGGRFLGFNVDPEFSNAVDGLVVLDLKHAPQPSLERYFGKEELQKLHSLFRGDRPAAPEAARTRDAENRGLYVPPDPRREYEQSPHSLPEGMNS